MTHLWPKGTPITVLFDQMYSPQQFMWRGKKHRVKQITKRWRVDQDWWQRRIWREYFKLSTGTGLLVVIYRDLVSGQWYLQRLYD